MKERTNEQVLDTLADMLEPACEILTDEEVKKRFNEGGKNKIKAVSYAIKNHKAAIIQLIAANDGVKPEDLKLNLLTLPKKALDLFNSPEIQSLFHSAEQTKGATSFGSATENITE